MNAFRVGDRVKFHAGPVPAQGTVVSVEGDLCTVAWDVYGIITYHNSYLLLASPVAPTELTVEKALEFLKKKGAVTFQPGSVVRVEGSARYAKHRVGSNVYELFRDDSLNVVTTLPFQFIKDLYAQVLQIEAEEK